MLASWSLAQPLLYLGPFLRRVPGLTQGWQWGGQPVAHAQGAPFTQL